MKRENKQRHTERRRLHKRVLPMPKRSPVEYAWNHLKNRELANLCVDSFGQFARRRLKTMRRRPTLVRSFWQRAKLRPVKTFSITKSNSSRPCGFINSSRREQ